MRKWKCTIYRADVFLMPFINEHREKTMMMKNASPCFNSKTSRGHLTCCYIVCTATWRFAPFKNGLNYNEGSSPSCFLLVLEVRKIQARTVTNPTWRLSWFSINTCLFFFPGNIFPLSNEEFLIKLKKDKFKEICTITKNILNLYHTVWIFIA